MPQRDIVEGNVTTMVAVVPAATAIYHSDAVDPFVLVSVLDTAEVAALPATVTLVGATGAVVLWAAETATTTRRVASAVPMFCDVKVKLVPSVPLTAEEMNDPLGVAPATAAACRSDGRRKRELRKREPVKREGT
jgi:hypothetical protein